MLCSLLLLASSAPTNFSAFIRLPFSLITSVADGRKKGVEGGGVFHEIQTHTQRKS